MNNMKTYAIGGLDVGTTGAKIALFSAEGKSLATYYKESDVSRAAGHHEIDFGLVRDGVLALLKEAAAAYEIGAIGVTSFGESFVMLDENDAVLAPAMVYTDTRGVEEIEGIADKVHFGRMIEITGVAPHEMFSIGKILWFKNNRPELFQKAKKILLGQDFIVYTLTGVRQIDYSLAARTGAFDIEKKVWSQEVFHAAGVDPALLSTPVPTGSVAGGLRPEIREALGIDYDIRVVSAAHDQLAGMIGSGVFSAEEAMDGTGTVECIPVILSEKPSPEDADFYDAGYALVPYLDLGYACYAFSFTGGAMLKWFRDNFAGAEVAEAGEKGVNVYALLDSRVKGKPTGILALPHFAGAATPYMNMDAKAAMVGLTLEHNQYDLYKALMEATSYEMRLNFERMKDYMPEIKALRATGGGANSDVWLQIKADILGRDVIALKTAEVGAAGSAALAGVAIGLWPDLPSAVAPMGEVRGVFHPNQENARYYNRLYSRYALLYDAVSEII